MRNTLFLLCEDITVDSKTNQWSFFKHIERMSLTVPRDKFEEGKSISVKGRFNLVSFWEVGQSKELETKYQFVNEDGEILLDTPSYKMEAKEGNLNLKQRLILDQVVVKDSGTYYFKLFKKDQGGYAVQAVISINVVVSPKEEEQSTQAQSPQQ